MLVNLRPISRAAVGRSVFLSGEDLGFFWKGLKESKKVPEAVNSLWILHKIARKFIESKHV